jgi:hypothetical protein
MTKTASWATSQKNSKLSNAEPVFGWRRLTQELHSGLALQSWIDHQHLLNLVHDSSPIMGPKRL